MRKTVEAPDPMIRAVLQNRLKRIVELQGQRNRISRSRDQMSKSQMIKTFVAPDPVIIPDQTIKTAVLQNHLKRIVELQGQRNRINQSHDQMSKIQMIKTVVAPDPVIIPDQTKKTAVLQNHLKRIVELQGLRNRISRSHDQMSKSQVVKIRLLLSQMIKTIVAPDPVIIPDRTKKTAVLQNHLKRIVELQGLRNRISRSHDQMSKIQVVKIRLLPSQMIKTVEAPDPVIRAVLLQNHRKRKVEIHDQMKRILKVHNQLTRVIHLQNHQKKTVELQKLKSLTNRSRGQVKRNRVEKNKPLPDQMKKTVETPDQTIRTVLLDHQKKIVEHQNLNQMIKSRVAKI